MKPLVIYHANCADGFGAAFAAWLTLGNEAEYIPAQYGKEISFNDTWHGREVYILDFSFSRSVTDEFLANAKRVVWLDHHKTAFEMWAGESYLKQYSSFTNLYEPHHIVLDNNKSGAYLAWEYFHPSEELPMFIKHIDDYDRWVFAHEDTKAFIKALWSYAPWSFEQWSQFLEDTGFSANDGSGIDAWYREGAAILRAHDQNVQSVVKGATRAVRIPIQTEQYGCTSEPGLAANCPPHLTSDVGHELATQSGTFGLCWVLSKTGMTANCSLRSNGGYDVSAIAKAFGGGGHRNAAGFEVDIQTLLGWLK